MRLVYRPIDVWPGDLTDEFAREGHSFKASWSDTLELLGREVALLGADELVLQVAADERAMRLDGGLRSDAKPTHPGVIVSFESRSHGALRYFTDRFTRNWGHQSPGWQANVRAIALGLEALRKVERYGIANRGEQYTGWSALPSGQDTTVAYRELLMKTAGIDYWPASQAQQLELYRAALKTAHPDMGGSTQMLMDVRQAAQYLGIIEPRAIGMAG